MQTFEPLCVSRGLNNNKLIDNGEKLYVSGGDSVWQVLQFEMTRITEFLNHYLHCVPKI